MTKGHELDGRKGFTSDIEEATLKIRKGWTAAAWRRARGMTAEDMDEANGWMPPNVSVPQELNDTSLLRPLQ